MGGALAETHQIERAHKASWATDDVFVGWISPCAIHQRNAPQHLRLVQQALFARHSAPEVCVGGRREARDVMAQVPIYENIFVQDLASYHSLSLLIPFILPHPL